MQVTPVQLDSSKIKTFSIKKCRSNFKNIFNSDEIVRIFSVSTQKNNKKMCVPTAVVYCACGGREWAELFAKPGA